MSVADASLPVALGVSLVAGALSFASPCVLPLVPGYLAFVAGLSAAEGTSPGGDGDGGETLVAAGAAASRRATVTAPSRSAVLPGAALFVSGFALFFTLVGGAFGALGALLAAHRQVVTQVGGVLVAVFGLFLLGVWRPALLAGDTRRFTALRRPGLGAAFPLGVIFGAGWAPCIGPTLGTILTLSAAGPHSAPGRGALLALTYALGLGLPFLSVAAGLQRGMAAVGFLRRHLHGIERAGGGLLLALGLALLTGSYDRLLAALRPFLSQVISPL